jgi:chitin synthase
VFGYITVLPGAFSAYRYIALQNDVRGEGPLQKYFLGETLVRSNFFVRSLALNVYSMELAQTSSPQICTWLRTACVEMRCDLWCLLLYSPCRSYVGSLYRNAGDHGFFITSSLRTPSRIHQIRCAIILFGISSRFDGTSHQVPELVSQRRRWLNGSFFAAIHSTVKFHYIYRSSHSFARKFWIHVELIYQTFNLIFSWFSLVSIPGVISNIFFEMAYLSGFCAVQGNFFISFFVLTNALEDPAIIGGKGIELVNTILKYSYVGLLLTCFILSLGNRPQGSNGGYTLAFVGFALFTIYMTVGAHE